ncbi:hypothetical protein [Streptomyces sp. DSM 40750]|uniref:hypothetical protein n=1 Tax=Streptomyces sp. DSM 40750 TaxID=2801030 RepID=UPI00214B1618|nr:hypothetical protein [Streptomyces sp. DSM 40750]UUU19285.1 hypothetical protein JIX55_02605 [Streptomyces sp. DSM 40750]UUU27371.1 hypothetical protein JIX55_48140 [Streptomyces sp. DSM 40750]
MQAPKSNLHPAQIEDAAHMALPPASSRGETRLVVADGSSGSAGSGWWARQLARDLCAAPGRAFQNARAFDDVAADATLRWPSYKRTLLEGVASSSRRAWLAQVRINNGPATTVLGIRLLPRPEDDGPPDCLGEGMWQVVSVGDSCMFQVRSDRVVESVAIKTRVPPVIRASSTTTPPTPELREGHWRSDDVFYLMTDALARWWTRHADVGGRPWVVLDTVCASRDDFPNWVQAQRAKRVLEDDDITLLRAECGPC